FSVSRLELVDDFDLSEVSGELKGDRDLGFMLYGMKFKDGSKPINGDWDNPVFSDKADPMYYRPHMIDGVIDVAKYREGIRC
ncbi:MAG: type I-C CRISPR-associated protein Cas5, partial [Oscillospiraceae bacterium]